MPAWIHERAKHILAKNPDMDTSQAFAIATQQGHKLGKTPKGYGTSAGRADAKAKYTGKKADYKKTPNPGKLDTPKLALDEKYVKALDTPDAADGTAWDPEEERYARSHPLQLGVKQSMLGLPRIPGAPKLVDPVLSRSSMAAVPSGLPSSKVLQQARSVRETSLSRPKPDLPGLPKIGFQVSEFAGPMENVRLQYRSPNGMPRSTSLPQQRFEVPTSVEDDYPAMLVSGNKTASLSHAAHFAVDAVGRWQLKKMNEDKGTEKKASPTTPAGRLTQARQVGAPKTTAPPGPSISQISKPIGFGRPLPGTTKTIG